MGNEYNWKTIRIAVISSESRFKFLAAKLISLGILILLGMVIAIVFGFIMSLITTAIGGYGFDFSFITRAYAWTQFLQFLRTFWIIMPFGLLAFFMAIFGRSAMPGIATGIGWFFLESIITAFMRAAGGWIANVPNYLMSANVNALNGGGGGGVRVGMGANNTTVTLPSIPHALIVLGVYSLAFLALSLYVFKSRDVTG